MKFSYILAEMIQKEDLVIEGDLEQKAAEVMKLIIKEEKKQGAFR
jgi:hypothetical protein